jgi:hypothetical protein
MKESKIILTFQSWFIFRVYGLGDLFGDIGGFKETLILIGGILFSFL